MQCFWQEDQDKTVREREQWTDEEEEEELREKGGRKERSKTPARHVVCRMMTRKEKIWEGSAFDKRDGGERVEEEQDEGSKGREDAVKQRNPTV